MSDRGNIVGGTLRRLVRATARRLGVTRRAPSEADGDDRALRDFLAVALDTRAYLALHPDVQAAGLDPVRHLLESGLSEGRRLPGRSVLRGAQAEAALPLGWERFARRGGTIAISPPEAPEDRALRDFLRDAFDPQSYLRLHPDLAGSGLDPLEHWLDSGLYEGRRIPGLTLRRVSSPEAPGAGHLLRFSWRGETVVVAPALSQELLAQIRDQARHDPAVLAPGARAIGQLRQIEAADLADRDGLDVPAMLAAAPQRPATVLVLPFLLAGGAEKYAADLTDALTICGAGPVLVLVTDQTATEARGWEGIGTLAAFVGNDVRFWRDICGGPGHALPEVLARYLHALQPRLLIVVNSRVGLEAVARFGRGLSRAMRISCTYFSMGLDGVGAPYGTRYPRRTLPFAAALTDNDPMAERLRELHGAIPGPGIVLLPPRLIPLPEEDFAARLEARLGRPVSQAGPKRWVWVSRIEPLKGTAVLAALAAARPSDVFEVYGLMQADPAELGLSRPNILLHPPLMPGVMSADFGAYDGFLFTSLFEGMPNIVLEMSQLAIPMVLADVGGLRGTFDDDAALFVCHGADTAASTAAFGQALDRLAAMTPKAVAAMATAARRQAVARHAPEAYARAVRELFGPR